MKRTLIALLALTVTAHAAPHTLDLTPRNTRIDWTLGDVLHTVQGTFKLKGGKIAFDDETGAASGKVIVDVKSGESGNSARDNRMHANVLESAKYPEAVFIQDRIDGYSSPHARLHGTFTIHGAGHEMTIDVQRKASGDRLDADLTFDLPYVAWGMKDPGNILLKVNKTVQVTIHFTETH